ncbi:MAG: oxidoreductase, partial [Elusimicrobia bacterium]
MPETSKKLNDNEIDAAIDLLETLYADGAQLSAMERDRRVALLTAAGKLSRPTRDELKSRAKSSKKAKQLRIFEYNRNLRKATGIRSARESSIFEAPNRITNGGQEKQKPEMTSARNCYICKAEFKQLHHFYDQMCGDCGDFNYAKRFQTADLSGQIALITGSRLKIGYQATLMMLKAGATVIATTRFPIDSAARYAKEKTYNEWKDRLHIYGLDLRHTPSVERFCDFFTQKYGRLDQLLNNAAQTVRRPPGFYAHLLENETIGAKALVDAAKPLVNDFQDIQERLIGPAKLSQIPYAQDFALAQEAVFPDGALDADLQQVDLRTTNSWRLRLGEIETAEMFELQLVNSIAPFVLCNKLAPLMEKDETGVKHIVNVSAMEGKFQRFFKADRHPHTNMAKAALNMLTHTSASRLAK